MQPTNMEQSCEANLDIILKESREFRRLKSETKKREDINKIYKRVEEAEGRIDLLRPESNQS